MFNSRAHTKEISTRHVQVKFTQMWGESDMDRQLSRIQRFSALVFTFIVTSLGFFLWFAYTLRCYLRASFASNCNGFKTLSTNPTNSTKNSSEASFTSSWILKLFYVFRFTRCSLRDMNSWFYLRFLRATGVSKWNDLDRRGENTKTASIESNSKHSSRKCSPDTTKIPSTWFARSSRPNFTIW